MDSSVTLLVTLDIHCVTFIVVIL